MKSKEETKRNMFAGISTKIPGRREERKKKGTSTRLHRRKKNSATIGAGVTSTRKTGKEPIRPLNDRRDKIGKTPSDMEERNKGEKSDSCRSKWKEGERGEDVLVGGRRKWLGWVRSEGKRGGRVGGERERGVTKEGLRLMRIR